MARKLKYDIPGRDWRRTPEELSTLGWEALFGVGAGAGEPRVVEIGFGRGEFITDLATNDPGASFLGIEVSFKRVLKLARRIAARPIDNVRLVHARAQDVIGSGLPADSVDRFWINFPAPWPKKRHAKHRLVQADFVALLATRLRPGGLLRLATDHRGYAEQMYEVLSAEPRLRNAYAPLHWCPEVEGRMHTGYEQEWRDEGRPLHFFEYRRM